MSGARERLARARSLVERMIIGHDDMIDAVFLALAAREHAVLIGPPGIAKTYLVKAVARSVSARFYSFLLTRFTKYDELFGPVDVVRLAEEGVLVRRWSEIVRSEIVFLDEVFKANTAILNSLLSLMQERIVYDSMTGGEVSASLWSLIGASNEAPRDEDLAALYDRFSIRVFSSYLDDPAKIAEAFRSRWQSRVVPEPRATMDDVRAVHSEALALMSSRPELYEEKALPLFLDLRRKIEVSDRMLVEKLPKLYYSYLVLNGFNNVNAEAAPLDLSLYMARTRDELVEVRKWMDELLSDVSEMADKINRAKAAARIGNLQAAKELLEEVLSVDPAKFSNKPLARRKAEALLSKARRLYRIVNDRLKQLEGIEEI